MLKELLLVGSGSFIGGVLRYLLSLLIKFDGTHFPYATFLVNIMGCFIIGIIYSISLKNNILSQNTILFLTVGLCGGLTTFSTFSKESLQLVQNGFMGLSILYIILSVILGIIAAFLGINVVK
ncbi:MAG: fluoride efflux transporter CrcB [Neisseriaceae bacterium]|nr:fluoride efflux transporter CrcB [Neisseriaceae bacterium]